MKFDVNNVFSYHTPTGDQPQRYEMIRSQAKIMAETINVITPGSPEKDIALRKLQEAVMWANASVALNS